MIAAVGAGDQVCSLELRTVMPLSVSIVCSVSSGSAVWATLIARAAVDGSAVGVDVSEAALERARRLSREEGLGNVAFQLGDAQTHAFPPAHFDLCISRFGTMFFADPVAAFTNVRRALRPGARLVILEMTLPPDPRLRAVYQVYFRRVLPRVGRLISKHTTAYTWLPESTQAFPPPAELARRLTSSGFTDVRWRLFFGGVCALHIGTRSG